MANPIARIRALADLVLRLDGWDMLWVPPDKAAKVGMVADGPYWRAEITKVLFNLGTAVGDVEELVDNLAALATKWRSDAEEYLDRPHEDTSAEMKAVLLRLLVNGYANEVEAALSKFKGEE